MYGRLLTTTQGPTKGRGTKKALPSQKAWDQHKDEIVRLYIDQNMRLEDVTRKMAEDHNFIATYGLSHHSVGGCANYFKETNVQETFKPLGCAEV
jgi:hypothetical protein